MRHNLVHIASAILLTLAGSITSALGGSASSIMIVDAFARASATPGARAGAAYVSVMNHAAEADRLVGASSPVSGSASIHRTEVVDGVMKMAEAGPIDIAPMATLEMRPGGYHIMLIGLLRPLKAGEEIDVMLTFEKAGDVMVKVRVGGVAEGGHDHGSGEGSGG